LTREKYSAKFWYSIDLVKMLLLGAPIMKRYQNTLIRSFVFLFSLIVSGYSQSGLPQKQPELIIDTDIAEETEKIEEKISKERDPKKAEEIIDIGNHYLRQKNYFAAIQRYLEALEYQPDSFRAHEALGRAYEKNGDTSKALELYNKFLEENPNSPKSLGFKARIAKLTKKS
jgi:tetratricopeptide (TPR) repeat protein